MKATGVVRRVDDLGRIVIPKEIRKNLRINDGEELEVFVDDDAIVLRKFSNITGLEVVGKKICDSVNSFIEKTILISDRDKFVTGSGELKKNYINKKISSEIVEVITNREVRISRDADTVELAQNLREKYSYAIYPIISFGDVLGTIVIVDSSELNDFDITIINMISQFLGKYVED